MMLLWIAIGGGFGSAVRYLVDAYLTKLAKSRFPWGLLVVNSTGAFALGALLTTTSSTETAMIAGVGFLGGYTTLSAASLASARLSLRRENALMLLSSAGMLAVCVLAAALGALLGKVS